MGIHDRDYHKLGRQGRMGPILLATQTAVASIIAVNVLVWIVEIAGGNGVVAFLAASPRDLVELRLYKLLTAVFAHSPDTLFHLAGNMLFLFFFGRELEQIYGRMEFYLFYVAAGVLSILAELLGLLLAGFADTPVLGASGAVMGVIVLFTLFYPRRQILFLFFVPAPVWALCVAYIVMDVLGLLGGFHRPVANLAHLTGAALALLYWYLDLRLCRLGRRLSFWRIPKAAIIDFSNRRQRRAQDETARVSRRIDALLTKIHSQGMESLTTEERDFLKKNAGRYVSEREP